MLTNDQIIFYKEKRIQEKLENWMKIAKEKLYVKDPCVWLKFKDYSRIAKKSLLMFTIDFAKLWGHCIFKGGGETGSMYVGTFTGSQS